MLQWFGEGRKPISSFSAGLFCFMALGAPVSHTDAPVLRIGVFGLFHPSELIVEPVSGELLELVADEETVRLEGAQRVLLSLVGDRIACRAGRLIVLAQSVRVRGCDEGAARFMMSVPGRIDRVFNGRLEVRAIEGILVPVIEMELEIAVASAVAAESPPGAVLEALKAQAVVTRSFYAATQRRHRDFDFCDTTHCQFLRSPPDPESHFAKATAETRGLLLTYRGTGLGALFSRSCGGRTRSLAELGMRSESYPYFAVECRHCQRHAQTWESRLAPKDAANVLAREPSENERLRIVRTLGWNVIPSNNYRAYLDGKEVVVRGRGAGHGVGLCQEGAAAMASAGARFNQILSYYLHSATSRGAILEFPLSPEVRIKRRPMGPFRATAKAVSGMPRA